MAGCLPIRTVPAPRGSSPSSSDDKKTSPAPADADTFARAPIAQNAGGAPRTSPNAAKILRYRDRTTLQTHSRPGLVTRLRQSLSSLGARMCPPAPPRGFDGTLTRI